MKLPKGLSWFKREDPERDFVFKYERANVDFGKNVFGGKVEILVSLSNFVHGEVQMFLLIFFELSNLIYFIIKIKHVFIYVEI